MAQVVGPVKGPVTGFCVKCRAKKELKNPEEVILKNGRRAIRGTCPTCGTTVYVFMGSKKAK